MRVYINQAQLDGSVIQTPVKIIKEQYGKVLVEALTGYPFEVSFVSQTKNIGYVKNSQGFERRQSNVALVRQSFLDFGYGKNWEKDADALRQILEVLAWADKDGCGNDVADLLAGMRQEMRQCVYCEMPKEEDSPANLGQQPLKDGKSQPMKWQINTVLEVQKMNDNLKFWNTFDTPPKNALKEIQAGRLKGKTDINPQWRYKAMTEAFGVIGFGWKYTIDRQWTEQGENGETMVFVNVSVFVKVDGEWSEAVPGTGGSTLVVKESKGFYNDDDAFKKAMTDALGVALAKFGVAADVYMGLFDGSKNQKAQDDTIISNDLWERYTAVFTKSQKLGLKVTSLERSKSTRQTVEKHGVELKKSIDAIEAQNKAGE